MPAQLKSPLSSYLDALAIFYQQERMWVYRTRASLCIASRPSSSSSDDEEEDEEGGEEEEETIPKSRSPSRARSCSPSPRTRYGKRRHGFGCSSIARPPTNRQRAQILELFEDMMQSRMQSCQRLNQLVRNVNRADLRVGGVAR